MIEPLHFAFDVACPVHHAFETWTERSSLWWPRSHTADGDGGSGMTFEPRLGGRIFERTAAGEERDCGEVTVWEPPRRVCYRWHIMTTPDRATDVEIRFDPLETGETRVAITHSGWERLGADAESWRGLNNAGWDGVLPHYIRAATLPR